MPVGYYCYNMSINAFAFGLLANHTKRLIVFALLGALANVEIDLIHVNLPSCLKFVFTLLSLVQLKSNYEFCCF